MAHFFVRLKRRETMATAMGCHYHLHVPERVYSCLKLSRRSSALLALFSLSSSFRIEHLWLWCVPTHSLQSLLYIICSMMFSIEWRECVGWRISTQCVAKKGKKDNTSPGWRERERDEVKEATTTTDGKFFSTFHQPAKSFFSFSTRLSALSTYISNTVTIIYFFCFCFCLFRELCGRKWFSSLLDHHREFISFSFLTFVSVAQLNDLFWRESNSFSYNWKLSLHFPGERCDVWVAIRLTYLKKGPICKPIEM